MTMRLFHGGIPGLRVGERRRLYRLWGKADEEHLARYAAELVPEVR